MFKKMLVKILTWVKAVCLIDFLSSGVEIDRIVCDIHLNFHTIARIITDEDVVKENI